MMRDSASRHPPSHQRPTSSSHSSRTTASFVLGVPMHHIPQAPSSSWRPGAEGRGSRRVVTTDVLLVPSRRIRGRQAYRLDSKFGRATRQTIDKTPTHARYASNAVGLPMDTSVSTSLTLWAGKRACGADTRDGLDGLQWIHSASFDKDDRPTQNNRDEQKRDKRGLTSERRRPSHNRRAATKVSKQASE